MVNNEKDFFNMKRIKQLSSSAACAFGERVITVKRVNAPKVISVLRSKGFAVEVTNPIDKGDIVKIYFA